MNYNRLAIAAKGPLISLSLENLFFFCLQKYLKLPFLKAQCALFHAVSAAMHFNISGMAMPCHVRNAYSSEEPSALFPQLQGIQVAFHPSKEWLRDTMTQPKSICATVPE